jgi:hypothetical protein
VAATTVRILMSKSFLVLFFKKELLPWHLPWLGCVASHDALSVKPWPCSAEEPRYEQDNTET